MKEQELSSIFYLFQWQQQILSQIRKPRARLRARKKLHYPRYKRWHLSVLKTLKSRGWPAEATLTNPLHFFLFDFFSFLFLSLMPSKMGGKPPRQLTLLRTLRVSWPGIRPNLSVFTRTIPRTKKINPFASPRCRLSARSS